MKNITIELTEQQVKTLDIYLHMTTNHRKRELESCESMAKELDDNGNVKFPKMADNAKFWKETIEEIKEIQKVIEKARFS